MNELEDTTIFNKPEISRPPKMTTVCFCITPMKTMGSHLMNLATLTKTPDASYDKKWVMYLIFI